MGKRDNSHRADDKKYQALFENSITALFITRPDGTILEANRAACRMFGYTEEELKKLGRQGVIDPDSPGLKEKLKEREEAGSSFGVLIGIRKSGEKFWCEFSSSVFDDTGGRKMASVMLVDISGKMDLQERRKEQTTLYNIAKLNEIELSVDELLNESAKILKNGFMNPKFTGIQITYKGKEYSSDNFDVSDKKITAQSTRPDGFTLKIEAFIQDKEESKNLKFIEEENELTDAVAELLSLKLYQKVTRLDLERSNERFRYINQVTQEVIYEHDFEKDEITLSKNFETIFGHKFSDEEFTLDIWEKFLHPDDRDEIYRRLEKVLEDKNENKWIAEFRYAKKDGTYLHVLENSYIIRDNDGNVVRMIGSVKDISDQKIRELQKSITADVSLSFNQAGNLKDALNETLGHIVELKRFDLLEFWMADRDKKELQLIAKHYAPGVSGQFQPEPGETPSFKKGKGLPGNAWKKEKPLFWRNLDSRKTFVRNKEAKAVGLKTGFAYPVMDGGEVTGVLFLAVKKDLKAEPYYTPLFRELAVQLASEIKRKQLEEEFSRIFDSAPDGIIVAGFDGYLKKVNPAFCEILGYSEEELLSTPFIEFVHPNDRERTLQAYENENSGLGKSYFENRYVKKSGKVVWISWSIKVFPEEEVAYSVAKDVTEQKEIEELLDQANRLARIGSWEVDLVNDKVYWSDITREIHEEDPDFEPDLDAGLNYYKEGEPRERIQKAVEESMENGIPWDLELPIITGKGNERWIRTIGEVEIIEGKPVRIYGSFQDIHNRKIAELELHEKTCQLDAIANFNSQLIQRDHWIEALEKSLESFGVVADADRAYFFENRMDEDGRFIDTGMRLEWVKEGVMPEIDNPVHQNQKPDMISEIYEPLSNNKPYNMIVSEIKNSELREMMQVQKIKSLLMVPVFVDRRFTGFLGFDDCYRERRWEEEEITFLKTIALNLASAIENEEAEEALQKAFEEKNKILESIGDGFFAVDNEFNVEYWNNQAEELLYTSKENVLGKNLWEVFDKEQAEQSFNFYSKALKEKIALKFEDYYAPIGRWFDVNVYPSSQGISVFFKDITERKNAIREIEISNERFIKISEASKDAVWDYDVLNESLFWGIGFKELFGYDPAEFGDKLVSWEERIHEADRERVKNSFQNTLADKAEAVWTSEYRFQKTNGDYAYISDKGSMIRNSDGKVIRMVGAMSDITEQKETEEKLRKLNESLQQQTKELAASNAELEQFAFVASHDLQEPLRMITSFLVQLERKYEDVLDEKGKKYIHFATDGAKRMRQIILDLLDYSRVGRVDTDRDEVDLDEILDVVKGLHKKLIEEKKATVTWDEMPVIRAARGPMQQLLLNLVHNALSYHKKGNKPEVKIWSDETDTHWKFFVKDNGIGIAPEYKDKIFNIFQRLHGKEEFSGTGVGLAICKKIVEDHGGEIGVESEEGKGSTFYFSIAKNQLEIENDE